MYKYTYTFTLSNVQVHIHSVKYSLWAEEDEGKIDDEVKSRGCWGGGVAGSSIKSILGVPAYLYTHGWLVSCDTGPATQTCRSCRAVAGHPTGRSSFACTWVCLTDCTAYTCHLWYCSLYYLHQSCHSSIHTLVAHLCILVSHLCTTLNLSCHALLSYLCMHFTCLYCKVSHLFV